MTRSALGAIALGLGSVAVPLALAGCEAILGLGSETSLPEGGPPHDASADAPDVAHRHDAGADVAPLPGAAVVVASNDLASNWCAVTFGGDVECWGNNDSGQLGDGTTKASAMPVKVMGLHEPAASVSVGIGTVCAMTRSGGAYCWGLGQAGELGDGKMTPFSSQAVPVSGLRAGVTAISSGQRVACAVQYGKLFCWGNGLTQLLGTGSTTNALVPTPVPGLESGVTAVSVGINAACAVMSGDVYCWGGFDGYGELGNGSLSGSSKPVMAKELGKVTAVSVGAGFACALEVGGGVKCWGDGVAGALGNGQLAMSPVPVQVQGLESGVSAVSAGAVSVCAIKTDGSVVCWGYAADGELGNGSAESDSSLGPTSPVPVMVRGLSGRAVSIATGQAPCAAMDSGKVACWGIVAEDALTPVPVMGFDKVSSITTGGDLSTEQAACAVWAKGVSCWGGNAAGEFGNGTTKSAPIPVQSLSLPTGMTKVSTGSGEGTTCGIASGIAYCWGTNDSGQLGDGTKTSHTEAVGVAGLTGTALSVGVGVASACAVTTAGADAGGGGGGVHCWGDNTYGQLGNGTATSSPVPVPVTGLAGGVTAVSLGPYSACALLSDGTVDCWGANNYGQLGDGTQTTRLVPTKVVGVAGATAISLGWWSTCAVTSGTIQCWGDNTFGQLGSGATVSTSATPMAVFGISGGASDVSVGQTSVCAVVSGAAECWGLGPIGNGTAPITSYTAPLPVTGLASGVTAVSVAAWFACAIVSENVRCWGFNTAGELGNMGAVDAFLPIPVPGFP